MKQRTRQWETWILVTAVATFAAACSSSNDPPPPQPSNTPIRTATSTPVGQATVTPRPPAASRVTGLLVVNRSVTSRGNDALGAPPELWSKEVDSASFNQSLAHADWSVADVAGMQGLTAADGRFEITGLQPGWHTLQVIKTLDGNILPLTISFIVGDDGNADVVAEVAWGLVKSISTYADGGSQVRDIRGPSGSWLTTRDGRVSEFGDIGRAFADPDTDGHFQAQPCVDQTWECGQDQACGDDQVCACTKGCPFCDDACGPAVCVPLLRGSPYRCNPDDTCAQATDRCTCVASCPECADCTRKVCVPDCASVEIVGVTITSGPSQLVLGRQSQLYATALLSDGSQFDVTSLADWKSSDPSVATVDSWGTVSALAIGSTTLTATVGTVTSAPWPLAVVERPTLQRIVVQNPFCYCGPVLLGGPEVAAAVRPCFLGPPGRADILPVPNCGQVIQIGSTLQFTAIGEFADGSYEDLTKQVQWRVEPADVGDVLDGVFTARQAGTAQLTASLDGVVSDATEIRVVTQPTVIGLSIYAENGVVALARGGPVPGGIAVPCLYAAADASLCCCPGPLEDLASGPCGCGYSITVLRGDQLKFHATAQYDTGEWLDVTDQVTWRSTNAATATIDANGVMTAVAAGDATIDAVLSDVTSNPVGMHVVNEATLQYMYISQDGGDHVVAKGDQRFFRATGFYDVGFSRDITKDATWRSSDDSVGGFDTAGVFTGRAAGTVQVWAELDGQQSDRLSLEVYETSELTYCDPDEINRAVWSDSYNRVTLESDCSTYNQPGVVALRYSVTETQPHGGIFDPCLDLYVYQGDARVRTIREEGCGAPFLAAAAPGRDEAVLKYQLRAFWDLKDDSGNPVPRGTYTIYGRFYLYYDPVVSIDVAVLSPGEPFPTRTPTATPEVKCTPPLCAPGEVFYCPGRCPGGCGTVCATPTPFGSPVSVEVGSATGQPGEQVRFSVSLHAAGEKVAGVQNDLSADLRTAIAANADGKPDCTVNPAINKGATAFAFRPSAKGIRAVVFALDNSDPILDGAVLYTCTVNVAADAALGTYPLVISHLVASNPDGSLLPVTGTDGVIAVGSSLPDTPTRTPTTQATGVCYRGTSTCTGSSFPTAQSTCCEIFRLSASPLAISWCPADKLDAPGMCNACSNPCEGLPTPTPTPCGEGPPCPAGQHKICDLSRSCTDLFFCVCEGPPLPPTPTSVCLGGDLRGVSCRSDAECADGQCGVATKICTYGTWDATPCRENSDCPGGVCVALQP